MYLNLELINSIPLLFDLTDQAHSSPLLYYIKANSELIQKQLETYIRTDRETEIDFFNFLPGAEEMKDLKAEEIELLIQSLIATGKYSYIVLDLDTSINSRTLIGLRQSDQIYWLLNHDMYSFHKAGYLFEELHGLLNDAQLKDRVTFILNRYTGQLDPNLNTFNMNIEGYLPYVPEWKTLIKREQILGNSVFNQHIQELLTTLDQGVIAHD